MGQNIYFPLSIPAYLSQLSCISQQSKLRFGELECCARALHPRRNNCLLHLCHTKAMPHMLNRPLNTPQSTICQQCTSTSGCIMGHHSDACKADPVQQSFCGPCHTIARSIEDGCGLFRSSSGDDGSSGGGLATILSGSSGEMSSQCNLPARSHKEGHHWLGLSFPDPERQAALEDHLQLCFSY